MSLDSDEAMAQPVIAPYFCLVYFPHYGREIIEAFNCEVVEVTDALGPTAYAPGKGLSAEVEEIKVTLRYRPGARCDWRILPGAKLPVEEERPRED